MAGVDDVYTSFTSAVKIFAQPGWHPSTTAAAAAPILACAVNVEGKQKGK